MLRESSAVLEEPVHNISLPEAAELPRTPELDELQKPMEQLKMKIRQSGGEIKEDDHDMTQVMSVMGDALQNPNLDARDVWAGVEENVEEACDGDPKMVLISMMECGLTYMTDKVHAVTGSEDEGLKMAAAEAVPELGRKPPVIGKLMKPMEKFKEQVRKTHGDMSVSDGNVMDVAGMMTKILEDGDMDAENVWPYVKDEIADVCEEIGIDPEELQYVVLQRSFFKMTEKVQKITAKPKKQSTAPKVTRNVQSRRSDVAGRIGKVAPAALAV